MDAFFLSAAANGIEGVGEKPKTVISKKCEGQGAGVYNTKWHRCDGRGGCRTRAITWTDEKSNITSFRKWKHYIVYMFFFLKWTNPHNTNVHQPQGFCVKAIWPVREWDCVSVHDRVCACAFAYYGGGNCVEASRERENKSVRFHLSSPWWWWSGIRL